MRLQYFTCLIIFLLPTIVPAQVINLSGQWKFRIDDRSQWSSPDYDDSRWESIEAPAPWEDEGFYGYDGFAWYRKKFDGKKLNPKEGYVIRLGFIDDCDEVYINGTFIGFSGTMPPHFKTAYNTEREYWIPNDVINFSGENLIAIRVFDVVHGGGIVDGILGIFKADQERKMLVDLRGIWSIAKSERGERIENEKSYTKIMVPSPWEQQGFAKYDGFAWYRKTFTLPSEMPTEGLVAVLGKIDDFDKVYLNGQFIGGTNDRQPYGRSESYRETRAYEIPPNLLKKSGTNVLEVRVLDMGNTGGIYEGFVGITSRKNFERYYED